MSANRARAVAANDLSRRHPDPISSRRIPVVSRPHPDPISSLPIPVVEEQKLGDRRVSTAGGGEGDGEVHDDSATGRLRSEELRGLGPQKTEAGGESPPLQTCRHC